MKDILEQSNWFEGIDLDKYDYPTEKLIYTDNIENQTSLFDDYNIFDCLYGINRYVKLSELFDANTDFKWSIIKEKVIECESITIVNDVSFQNEELDFIKQFYISVFYSALKKENPNCYIYNLSVCNFLTFK